MLGPVNEWKILDCIDVHKLLETIFGDQDVANSWKARCAEYFPYSTYFEGIKSASAAYCSVANSLEDSSENGIVANAQMKSADGETCTLNGTVHIVDELSNLSIR